MTLRAKEPLVDIAITQAKAEGHPDPMADHLGREVVVLIAVDGSWAPTTRLAHQMGAEHVTHQVDNTPRGINEMDPPLYGMALISHNEVSEIDPHVTARRRVP
jgi:hypothetical protein